MGLNSIGVFGGGVQDSLEDLIVRKMKQAEQDAQIANAQQQRDLQVRGQNIQMRGQDQAHARYEADRQNALAAKAQTDAEVAETKAADRAQGHLRAAIQGSQNVAGSGDPTGAAATRGSLRVALQAGGAKPTEIPQEPVPAKPTTKPLIRIGRDGTPTNMGDIPADAATVNEPAPAGASHPRFNIVQGADADGKPAMIRTNVDTGQIEVLSIPAGANFVKRDQPATQDQSNLALYANRVEQADPILKKLEGSITKMNPLVFAAQLKADHPSMQSAEVQQYNQAARNFINSVLRRESGAAIAESEFANARGQYLPVPGDSPQVLAQKAENRRIILENYKRSAGPAYKPMSSGQPTGKSNGADPLGIRK